MNEKISLSELQQIIRDSLYLALPDHYWIVAEISEIKENYAGHCYLELVEKQSDETSIRARIKGVIWSNRYRFLKTLFIDTTGEPLREGMKILIRARVEYHEVYGLSLLIHNLDPSFTVGEMAVKKKMVIRRLEEEGVFNMNRELDLNLLPQRIAVISSENAAGYRDFINHIKGNIYRYRFSTKLYEAVMQGSETEKSIISALDRIAENTNLFDAVAIIRGGGSQSDLSWFDNYNIAFHVTQFPLPVITGIGHDKDMSVTDMVAFRALKTPTAVADFFIESVAAAEELLNRLTASISDITRTAIDDNRSILESLGIKLSASAGLIIAGKRYHIERLEDDLATLSANTLDRVGLKLKEMNNRLSILDPVNVLKRGYSITTVKGRVLKKAAEAAVGDIMITRLHEGTIESRVLDDGNKKG
ncbi:MAG TPA: exodeoxyribonuclease VII large subunit [Bacteroidales bacterium]|nr:exodeoxyribonuclease VII large subunit [Bacteroidales bacterium]HPJ60248.1 exodeoxyribonuclease VII large subunit [Bacteroidales bacterium]HPR13565.1 exodeoxyribonuclease VII large subunit [Bacteroidales bacterium]HRW86448.1 exodeoxyribonuclease VII large subunit [Bacteroidales bacterium]